MVLGQKSRIEPPYRAEDETILPEFPPAQDQSHRQRQMQAQMTLASCTGGDCKCT